MHSADQFQLPNWSSFEVHTLRLGLVLTKARLLLDVYLIMAVSHMHLLRTCARLAHISL